MKKQVIFRDADMTRFTVTFEIKVNERKLRNRNTLEYFTETREVSITGECGSSVGQCVDHINPRTEGQQLLKDFWNRYHINRMDSGTADQDEYLHSDGFVDDVKVAENAAKMFYSQPHTHDFMLNDLAKVFGEDQYNDSILKQFDGLDIQKISSMLEDWMRQFRPNYAGKIVLDPKDYYVRCALLTVKGYWNDRGYRYGTSWLYEPLPVDIEDTIDALIEKLEDEEDELTEQLEAVFDMGNGFVATDEYVDKVMELRDCDRNEATQFLVVGMHLEVTFGDLNESFDTDGEYGITAMGCDYYVGTESDLEEYAKNIVHGDSEYEYFWREAVAAERTTEGLEAWLDSLIDSDGWCYILNHYDGNYREYSVDDNDYVICRR